MNQVSISSYISGGIGRIVELHGTYYAQHWDLGLYFEAKVAAELGAFMAEFDDQQDGAWFAHMDGHVVGGIFIVGQAKDPEGTRLRWFIIDPEYQGCGLGKQLMAKAMDFCREKGFKQVYLTTFAGLSAARHLYEAHGFQLVREEDGQDLTGSADLVEQVFICKLD